MKNLLALFSVVCLSACGLAEHIYPTNPDPSHKEFFGKMTRDSLVVTNLPYLVESDPVFSAWYALNPFAGYATEAWVTGKGYATTAQAEAAAEAAVEGFYTEEYQPHMQQIATSLNSKLTKPGSITSGNLVEFSGTSGATADSGYSVDSFYLTSQPIYSTQKIWVKSTDVSNPSYVTVGRIRASGDSSYPYSRMGTAYFKTWGSSINYTSYQDGKIVMNWSDEQEEDAIFSIPTNRIAGGTLALREDIPAAPDFSTNNTELVTTITNLAPSKAKGISIHDTTLNCDWYLTADDGTFTWLVEE